MGFAAHDANIIFISSHGSILSASENIKFNEILIVFCPTPALKLSGNRKYLFHSIKIDPLTPIKKKRNVDKKIKY
jgi:hypothetical protein